MRGNIVPETSLTPDPRHLLDPEAAVAIGTAHRADLALLRMLCRCVNQDNMSDASSALGRADTLLGRSLTPTRHVTRLFERRTSDCELPARRQQLCQLADERQRTVAGEIRTAAIQLETRIRQVALGRDLLADWDRHLSELKERREADQLLAPDRDAAQPPVSVLDISRAILQRLDAESDLIHRVVAWQLALVELHQAQGLLAHECGYPLPCSCNR